MARASDRNNQLVELDQGVFARTSIPSANHAALRAGFAGYTSNPRWNAAKFRAWRVGRAWRDAVADGRMAIRPGDSLLVAAADLIPVVEEETERSPSDPSPADSPQLGQIAANEAKASLVMRLKSAGFFKRAELFL
ncbi:MAG: hypothetical protein VKK04_06960 [Synechococcales bacterium]|nr:hypothetical protein [Synechococcales bacterium]